MTDEILAEAQRRLEARRAERPAGRALAPAAAVLARLSSDDAAQPGACSACGDRLFGNHRERGRCEACANPPAPAWSLAIPERYRWAQLDAPLIPPGETRMVVPEAARLRALAWARGEGEGPKNAITIGCVRWAKDEAGNQVMGAGGKPQLVSPTGSGKTTLAAAIARYCAEHRRLPLTWVHAGEMRGDYDPPETPKERMRALLRAPLSVLDGLGKELAGAENVPGWLPARMTIMQDYAAKMYDRNNGIRIVTLDLPREALAGAYGADLVRRFGKEHKGRADENATILML